MRAATQRHFVRTGVLIISLSLVLGTAQYYDLPIAAPALAKGVGQSDEETKADREGREEKETKPSRVTETPTQRQPDSRTESESQPRTDTPPPPTVERKTETRKESRTDIQPKTATPDVTGQIEKRSEERDPEYEFRRHYYEPFFYPYDYHLYRYLPGRSRPALVLVPEIHRPYGQGWRSRYGQPALGSLDEALMDIEAIWRDGDARFLMWHVPSNGYVEVYQDGRYSHTLSSRDIYNLTVEALDRIRTIDFRFTSVDKHGYTARAGARHTYLGPDRRERTAQLTYYLEKVTNRWYLTRIDIRGPAYGVTRCFIATAAFGTPMADEVLVLTRFRDSLLLKTVGGKALVATYYVISPPIANLIEDRPMARAFVRFVLKPVVYVCRLVLPAGTS